MSALDSADAWSALRHVGVPLWLELNGVIAAHGNIVRFGEQQVAFLAPSGTGKSTLSLAMIREGARLVADDFFGLIPSSGKFLCFPQSELALWEDNARQLLDTDKVASLPRVHPNVSKLLYPTEPCSGPRIPLLDETLDAVYVLNRQDGDIDGRGETCQELRGYEKAEVLLRNALVGWALRPMGIEAKRLPTLMTAARSLRVRRLSYRSGYENLETLCQEIYNDLTR